MHEFLFRTLLVLILSLGSSQIFAAAGDVIDNIAIVNYIYQGVPLTQESSPFGNPQPGIGNGASTSFIEDRLINFSIASNDATLVPVTSAQTATVLTFTVTNNGNATQDFLLTAVNTATSPFASTIDNFDPLSPMRVFVEDGTTSGYQLAEDKLTFIDELSAGASVMVYIVTDMPVVLPGDVAAVSLIAQIASGGAVGEGLAITNDDNGNISPAGIYGNGATSVTVGVATTLPNSAAMETVFNDPAGLNIEDVDSTGLAQDIASNGQASDSAAFQVQGSPVELIKSFTVIDSSGGSDPRPGSTLHYQINVVIGGASNINNLIITDQIPANTTFTPASLSLNGVVQTDASDAPIDYSEFNGSNIVVDLSQGGTVSVVPATTNLIVFDVTIN
ncbi:MAG: hypothetical protein OEY66_04905 [Gammaproteobacteria bacterium]|nr:hypothetical protein [Gammaproteobacteria bacterium]